MTIESFPPAYGLFSATRRSPRLVVLILAAVTIAVLLSIPLITIVSSVFVPTGEIWAHLTSTVLPRYIQNTFFLIVGVGAVTFLVGVTVAWLVTMCTFPGRAIFEWALLLPLAMPAYVIAYTYGGMFDFAGPVQSFLRELFGWSRDDYWFPQIRSLTGAITILGFVFYPYVYLLSRAAFLDQSICVLEVGRSLGSNPWKIFIKIAVPLARPAIVAGIVLAIMETLGDFGAVQYLAVDTLSTGIFRTWYGLGSLTAASQLAAILLAFVVVIITLERLSRGKKRFSHTSTRYKAIRRYRLRPNQAALAFMACFIPIFMGFLLPVLQLLGWFIRTSGAQLNAYFIELTANTLFLAFTTSVLSVILGLVLAWSIRMTPNKIVRASARISSLGYAVPGTVVAVGVLIPFAAFDNTLDQFMRQNFSYSTGLLLSGTFVAVIFAYLVRFQALSFNAVESSLEKISPSIDDAARTLGFRYRSILTRVHTPIIKGGILTAGLLVFIDVMKELPVTLVLRPFNFNTLAVRTYELASEERLADAATPAIVIVLSALIPVILLSMAISRSRPGQV